MAYLHGAGWARTLVIISTFALSCRHGMSLVSGVCSPHHYRRVGSSVSVSSSSSSICVQQVQRDSSGNEHPARFSRVVRLRGGDQAKTALVADDSNVAAGDSFNGGLKGEMLDSEKGAQEGKAQEANGTNSMIQNNTPWRLLGVSEHDRSFRYSPFTPGSNPRTGAMMEKASQRLSRASRQLAISALALPALMSLLVDPILSLVDTAYVGRGLGAISLAALGPCTSIFHFSFNTFRSLTQSTTALVGKSLAAGDEEEAGQIVQQMYVIACVLGAGLQVALLTQAPAILALMGAGPSTALFKEASGYLKVRALAAPAVLLIMVSEGVFRGHANTRAPAVAALSAAVANIILDPIFMFALSMGVAGAAGATAFAQYLAVALYGGMLWRGARAGRMAVPFFAPSRRRRGGGEAGAGAGQVGKGARGDEVATAGGAGISGGGKPAPPAAWSLLVTVISANAAMLLRTTSLMSCWAVATAVATRMSSAAVGAHQVALSLWLLFALVAEAPSIAAQVLGARYIAQGKLDTARSMARRVVTLTLACSGVLATVLLSLSGVIPRGFTSDPEVLRRLHRLLPLLAFQQPLIAMTLVAEGLLVGAGEFRWLGTTTVCSSALAAWFIFMVGSRAPAWDVLGIWGGITAMFVGRFLAAAWRVMDRKRGPYWALAPPSPPPPPPRRP